MLICRSVPGREAVAKVPRRLSFLAWVLALVALSSASLAELAPPSARPTLTQALSALDELKAVSAKIVELSRRNTNVLSLDLALRQKPALTAACDDRLHALQDALAKEGPKSSR